MLLATLLKAAGAHKKSNRANRHWSSRARNTAGSDGKPWGKRNGIIHTPAPAPHSIRHSSIQRPPHVRSKALPSLPCLPWGMQAAERMVQPVALHKICTTLNITNVSLLRLSYCPDSLRVR